MCTEEELERAAEIGAQRALQRVGLDYPEAARDINEVRNLIDAWRTAKKTAIATLVKTLTVALLVAVAAYAGFTIHRS